MNTVTRHHEFYFDEPDTVVFKVQKTLFRPHKFLLTRYCDYFRDSLDFSRLGEGGYGTTDKNPIKFADVRLGLWFVSREITSEQFALGLTMLYPERSHKYLRSLNNLNNEIQDLFEVGGRWGSDHIKSIVADFFCDSDILPFARRMELAGEYDIDVWLPRAFAALSLRFKVGQDISPLSSFQQLQFYRIRDLVRGDLAQWIRYSYAGAAPHTTTGCELYSSSRRQAGIFLPGLEGGVQKIDASLLDSDQVVKEDLLCHHCRRHVKEWKQGVRAIALMRATLVIFPNTREFCDVKIMHPITNSVFIIDH